MRAFRSVLAAVWNLSISWSTAMAVRGVEAAFCHASRVRSQIAPRVFLADRVGGLSRSRVEIVPQGSRRWYPVTSYVVLRG